MEDKIYAVPSDWTRRAFIDDAKYQAMYEASIRDPEAFWREHGDRIDWFTPYSRVKNATFGPGDGVDPLVRGRHHQRCL